ncbi:hypothetical protein [Vibrio sp. HN007]|uniref:hypothetical protein n=1 Tax=Vibrio iocasae TaxID=3098914 RepID=UPI0035D47924
MDVKNQIKEALERIVESTNYDMERLVIEHAQPNDVRVTFTNDYECEVAFKYSEGELFLCADGRQMPLK